MFGHEYVIRTLLQAGSNPVLVNHSGETPYQLAVKHKFEKIANFFKKFHDEDEAL
jgi:hypothetical protein